MRRRLVILLLAVAMCVPAVAQRIVESTEEFVSYNRNSISVLVTTYNDQYDGACINTVNGFDFGSKFDVNNIITKTVAVRQNRIVQDGSIWIYSSDSGTIDDVLTTLNKNNVGKEILTYILSPDSQGRFTRDVINTRGQWNASEKDYIESKATQVDAMGQNGEKLIDDSYIIVFDVRNPEQVETKTKDSKGKEVVKISWKANVGAMVFRIKNAEDVVNNVVNSMWITDFDDAATVAAKKKAFDDLRVQMELVATAGVTTSGKELSRAVANSKESIISKLEDDIQAWQVTIDCETVHPFITAKIGRKEGVKNGQRYGIYGQVYNSTEERLEFKRKGYVRATEVADNRRVADGTSDSTYFYRISGSAALTGAEILKQRNDLGIGISGNYNLNGSTSAPAESSMFGSFSMIEFGVDYLAFIQKRGFSHYIMINLGMDRINGDNLYKGHKEFGKYDIALDNEGQFLFKKGASYTNVTIGYMFGIKIKQFAEIQPFIRGGIDMVSANTTMELDEKALKSLAAIEDYNIKNENELTKSSNAYYLDPGVRMVFNVIYPVQIYLQANYSVLLSGDDKYNIINKYMIDGGYGHSNGLGVGGGVRVIL